MSAAEIGKKLVALCREGKNLEAIDALYDPQIESVEAVAPAQGERTTRGIEAVRAKNVWWSENHEIHEATAEGPYPHGEDRFAVRFTYDVTSKPSGQRFRLDEVALYTLKNDKVVKEEFFYDMG